MKHWNPIRKRGTDAINFLSEGIGDFKICTMDAVENFLILGGFSGEYVCKVLKTGEDKLHYGYITDDSHGITNHMKIMRNRNGGTINLLINHLKSIAIHSI